MENFWDYSVWSGFNLIAVLLASLLAANILRRCVGFLRNSPVSYTHLTLPTIRLV